MNEVLLTDAVRSAIRAEDAPYLLFGDVNTDPANSPTVAAVVDCGLLVDLGHEWAQKGDEDSEGLMTKVPENTYHKDSPTMGRQGKGSSRIDVILANPVAAFAIRTFHHKWDPVEEAHVPIEITMDTERLDEDEVVQKTAGNVLCKVKPEDIAE